MFVATVAERRRPARIRAAVILDVGSSAVEPEAEPSAPAHVAASLL
jgi:hypothetical protein